MTGDVTAIVLSAGPYKREFDGVVVQVHRSVISDSADLQRARFDAIKYVKTPWLFFLDDDDDLPQNHPAVIGNCMHAANLESAALAYTDELIRLADGSQSVRKSLRYSQHAHLRDFQLLHHLVLCRTDAALVAVNYLPRGHYCPEFMLYWQMAKSGAVYVPEVGYIWNKGDGMHLWPETTISQMKAALWCKEHPWA